MKTYKIYCIHEIYIDDFDEGETENVNNFITDGEYKAESPVEAIELHLKSLCYDFNKDYMQKDDESENVCYYSVLCDVENSEATQNEVKQWKKGKKILYSNNMILSVYELINAKI